MRKYYHFMVLKHHYLSLVYISVFQLIFDSFRENNLILLIAIIFEFLLDTLQMFIVYILIK